MDSKPGPSRPPENPTQQPRPKRHPGAVRTVKDVQAIVESLQVDSPSHGSREERPPPFHWDSVKAVEEDRGRFYDQGKFEKGASPSKTYFPIEILLEKTRKDFYIRRLADVEKLKILAADMDFYYNFRVILKQQLDPSEVFEDEYYAAHFNFTEEEYGVDSQHWIRVFVSDVSPQSPQPDVPGSSNDNNEIKVKVSRIDWGGEYYCRLKDLRYLIQPYRELPWTAFFARFREPSKEEQVHDKEFLEAVTTANLLQVDLEARALRTEGRYAFLEWPRFPYVALHIRTVDKSYNFIEARYPKNLYDEYLERFRKQEAEIWAKGAKAAKKETKSKKDKKRIKEAIERLNEDRREGFMFLGKRIGGSGLQ